MMRCELPHTCCRGVQLLCMDTQAECSRVADTLHDAVQSYHKCMLRYLAYYFIKKSKPVGMSERPQADHGTPQRIHAHSDVKCLQYSPDAMHFIVGAQDIIADSPAKWTHANRYGSCQHHRHTFNVFVA